MDKVKFELHTPQVVTLKSTGRIVDGNYGQQTYYTLQDGRAMYLDLGPAEQINQLGVRPGESIAICKRGKGAWEVALTPATERMRAARFGRQIPPDADESQVGRQVRQTLENISEGRPPAAPRPQAVPDQIARRLDSHPGAGVSVPAPGQAAYVASHSITANNNNPLVTEANNLVDVYAAVLDRALTMYQGRIKPDEIRSIVLSAYIQQGKQRGSSYAA
jgi:hypothetical protein